MLIDHLTITTTNNNNEPGARWWRRSRGWRWMCWAPRRWSNWGRSSEFGFAQRYLWQIFGLTLVLHLFVFGGMRNNRPLYTYTGAKSLSINSAGAYVLD